MLNELLREVIGITVNKNVEEIADLLNSNKYVNEFTIAKKLGITINQTRNILYKISDYSLVVHERQKDKKKGWYTYYWKFDILKCLEFLRGRVIESREKFENQITRREDKQYYICEMCNVEHSEDEALLMDFTCDECGDLFTVKDNANLLKGFKKNLEKIDEKLIIIDIEITKEKEKLNKKKQKMLKQMQKDIDEKKEAAKQKRAEKRAIVKKEKDDKKEAEKKTVKKKIVKKKVAEKKVVKKKVAKKKSPEKKVVKKKVVKKKVVKKVVVQKKEIKKPAVKNTTTKKVAERKIVKKKNVSTAVKNVVKRFASKKKIVKKKK